VAGLERLNTVRIAAGEEIVEIPWSSRFELLERLRGLHSGGDAVRRFEAVGVTRPVELDAASTLLVTDVIAGWADEFGPKALPTGISTLYEALVDAGASATPRSGAEAPGVARALR
jgi:hypothetical protein